MKRIVLLLSMLCAAEIFAAALRDCDRAVIVGDSRSFGKGTVLQVEKMKEGFALFRLRSKVFFGTGFSERVPC